MTGDKCLSRTTPLREHMPVKGPCPYEIGEAETMKGCDLTDCETERKIKVKLVTRHRKGTRGATRRGDLTN